MLKVIKLWWSPRNFRYDFRYRRFLQSTRKPNRLVSSLQLTYLSSYSFFLHAYQLFSFNWSIISVQPSSHSPFVVSSAYFPSQLPTLLKQPGAVRFRLSKRQSLEKFTRCLNLHFATQASRKKSIPKILSTGYHFSAAAAILNYSLLNKKSQYMFYYLSRMVPNRTIWNPPQHIHVRLALPASFPWVSLALIWPNVCRFPLQQIFQSKSLFQKISCLQSSLVIYCQLQGLLSFCYSIPPRQFWRWFFKISHSSDRQKFPTRLSSSFELTVWRFVW